MSEANWCLKPFVLERQVNVFYGLSPVGKSYFALALSAALMTGDQRVVGITPSTSEIPLMLDWMSSAEAEAVRLKSILSPYGLVDQMKSFHYRREPASASGGLWFYKDLGERINQGEASLLILDAVDFATSGRHARYFRNIIDALNCTTIAIAYKLDNRASNRWWYHWGANVWEIKGRQDLDGNLIGATLHHRKCAAESLSEPINYDILFDKPTGTTRFVLTQAM